MRAGFKLFMIAAALGVGSACHKQPPPARDQNMAIDDDLTNSSVPQNAAIEALPPDESSGTPSNELANGADNPNVNDLDTSNNSD